MKLTRICYKTVLFFYFLLRYKSGSLAFNLSNNNVAPKKCTTISKKGGNLEFGKTGSVLPVYLINKYYKKALHYIIEIFNTVKIDSIKETEKGVILVAGDISFMVSNESQAGNFYEIITRKLYDYYSGENKQIVLDIGMNVGLASLFFASKRDVEKVYAYEPFLSTFENAKVNLSINPSLEKKITPFNFGISNKNTIVKVPVFEGGSMEASVNEEFLKSHKFSSIEGGGKTIDIEVRDISEIIRNILVKENVTEKKALLLKIDCEGEEYNIIDKLNEDNLLHEISAMLIEWHHKGPGPIINTLSKNNFKLLASPITMLDGNIIEEAGMLYAFR